MVLIVPSSLWKVTITDRVGKCQQLSAVAGRWRQRVISRYDDDYNEYLFASLSFDLTINYEFSNENQVTAVLMNRFLGMHNKGVNVITPLLQQSDWQSDRHINGATYAQKIVKANQLQRNGSCFFAATKGKRSNTTSATYGLLIQMVTNRKGVSWRQRILRLTFTMCW